MLTRLFFRGGNDLQESKFDIQFLSDRVKEECIEPSKYFQLGKLISLPIGRGNVTERLGGLFLF